MIALMELASDENIVRLINAKRKTMTFGRSSAGHMGFGRDYWTSLAFGVHAANSYLVKCNDDVAPLTFVRYEVDVGCRVSPVSPSSA